MTRHPLVLILAATVAAWCFVHAVNTGRLTAWLLTLVLTAALTARLLTLTPGVTKRITGLLHR